MAENKKKRILIIEDEEQIIDVLDRKLKKEGFETLLARDGVKGLEKALKEKPDLILLDLILPWMDGMTLLSKLREDDDGKKIKVIVLTNLDTAEKIYMSKEKGVFDYLVKTNWTLDDVVERIREAFGEK